MKKTTKSLLVSATVLLSLAPAAALAATTSATTVSAADTITFDKDGHWDGPSLDVIYNNSIQVKTGSSQADLTKVADGDVQIVTVPGNEQVAVRAIADGTLYKTSQGAVLQQPKEAIENPTATAGNSYYQRVLISIPGVDTENILNSVKFPYTTARVLFNGAAMGYANYAGIKGNFAIYRKVTISDNPTNKTPDTSSVTYTDHAAVGEVKTNSETKVTPLYDGDGNLINTRALGPKTSWYTDTQRHTNEGVNYYRVSTSEWVKESDISYSPAD